MKNVFLCCISVCCLFIVSPASFSQDLVEQFLNFDGTSEGPWSDIDNTTITIPKVSSGSIQADADVSAAEYGGFEGIEVVPVQSAWILNYAQEKDWQGSDDNSFMFYTAYDDEFLYIGVDVKDDVVRSNDTNDSFWKDDAIELIFGNNPESYDYNTDQVVQEYGGHSYVNYEGRFSEWTDDVGPANLRRFALAKEWTYGEDGDVWGFGQETATGWVMECRFHHSIVTDPDIATFAEGNSIKFNIGIDDDDGAEMAIQYFWANRLRAIGYNPDSEFYDLLLEDEIANQDFLDPDSPAAFWPIGIDDNGRLSKAGAGDLIFGAAAADVEQWSLY